jgi:threo-3-hydroxy-L-aspartate ammonia-lyase
MTVEAPTVTFSDIEQAAGRVGALAVETPVATSRLFNEECGASAFLKCENLQRGGAFKIRGATNFLSSLPVEERKHGVVTFSSGNHAQAVAIAAAHFGTKATIVMPKDAPQAKLESTKLYGPEIVFHDRHTENREAIARKISEDTGAVVLPSYDHAWIVAGQGTTALELLRQQPDLDALVVPLGGGGLLSGSLIAAKHIRPGIKVFGVEPALADDWHQSLAARKRIQIASPSTLADGLRTTIPGELTFQIVQSLVDDVLLVSEDEIKATMRFLLTRMKMLVEPSGVVAAAALLHGKLPRNLKRVGVILSGGNVDLSVLADICREAA